MNATYRVNARFAVAKAQDAVNNWQAGLDRATQAGDPEGIEFCRKSLEACSKHLSFVREDIKNVHKYL